MFPKQDDSCFLHRMIPRSHAGRILFPTRDNSPFPNTTIPGFQTNRFVAPEQEKFGRPKYREDHSDFNDFLTELIALTRSTFSKIFAPPKIFSRRCRRIFLWLPVAVPFGQRNKFPIAIFVRRSVRRFVSFRFVSSVRTFRSRSSVVVDSVVSKTLPVYETLPVLSCNHMIMLSYNHIIM